MLQFVAFGGLFRRELLGANGAGKFDRLGMNTEVALQVVIVVEAFRAELAGKISYSKMSLFVRFHVGEVHEAFFANTALVGLRSGVDPAVFGQVASLVEPF